MRDKMPISDGFTPAKECPNGYCPYENYGPCPSPCEVKRQMTLTQAIEAAREAHQARISHLEQVLFSLEDGIKHHTLGHCGCSDPLSHALNDYPPRGVTICPWHKAKVTAEGVLASCKSSLAALPEPMTEEEMFDLLRSKFGGYYTMQDVTTFLKDHNVLFVKE